MRVPSFCVRKKEGPELVDRFSLDSASVKAWIVTLARALRDSFRMEAFSLSNSPSIANWIKENNDYQQ